MILQGILTLMLFYLVLKKIGEHFVLPVILMVTVLNPAVLPLSLQFSWVYFCGLLGAIAVLCMKDPAFRGRYLYLFLSVGMITSYLDLLTYPLITLGLPLVLLLLREQEQSTKARIFLVLKAGVSWVTGYAVMWIGKWILVSTFGQKNIVAEITGKITQRTALVGEGAESLSIDGVLFRNIQVLLKWPYLLAAFLFLVFCIYFRANSGEKKVVGKQFYRGIPYLIIMMIPIMWFVLLANHSWEHYWFTYRELSVSVLAGAVWALEMVVPDEGKGGNETWIK